MADSGDLLDFDCSVSLPLEGDERQCLFCSYAPTSKIPGDLTGGTQTMSVISTATALAVNPAFLQEIKDSNPDLWLIRQKLRAATRTDDDSAIVSRRLTRLLDDLRDALALQFSLEESYGYLSLDVPKNETLTDLAARAQSQHGTLYLQLSDLAEQAEELQYRGVEREQLLDLIDRIHRFDELWSDHERIENELIESTFDSSRR